MIRVPVVRPWKTPSLNAQYGVFLAALGYERRARYVAETLAIRANERFAYAFPDRKVFSYSENQEWFESAGYTIEEVAKSSFRSWCENVLSRIKSSKLTQQRICIDISSFDRFRIAVLIDVIRRLEWKSEIKVDFLYSLAEFSPPPKETAPNTHVGPVLPCFAGWSIEPERPPTAIVGLGYEEDKALGAVEHIQATEVWALIPVSPISPYTAALEVANHTLLESIPISRRLSYPVHQPVDCFIMLESLTNRILQSSNPVLFPFGPKMFTICALLIACLYPKVAVWRVSAGEGGGATDRLPSGNIFGLSVSFIPANEGAYLNVLEPATMLV